VASRAECDEAAGLVWIAVGADDPLAYQHAWNTMMLFDNDGINTRTLKTVAARRGTIGAMVLFSVPRHSAFQAVIWQVPINDYGGVR